MQVHVTVQSDYQSCRPLVSCCFSNPHSNVIAGISSVYVNSLAGCWMESQSTETVVGRHTNESPLQKTAEIMLASLLEKG